MTLLASCRPARRDPLARQRDCLVQGRALRHRAEGVARAGPRDEREPELDQTQRKSGPGGRRYAFEFLSQPEGASVARPLLKEGSTGRAGARRAAQLRTSSPLHGPWPSRGHQRPGRVRAGASGCRPRAAACGRRPRSRQLPRGACPLAGPARRSRVANTQPAREAPFCPRRAPRAPPYFPQRRALRARRLGDMWDLSGATRHVGNRYPSLRRLAALPSPPSAASAFYTETNCVFSSVSAPSPSILKRTARHLLSGGRSCCCGHTNQGTPVRSLRSRVHMCGPILFKRTVPLRPRDDGGR